MTRLALRQSLEADANPASLKSPHVEQARTAAALDLTVVIPTLNERSNIELLLAALSMTLARFEWEVIFVDDGSTDGTPELITDLARQDRRVRLIRRIGRRGLSTAVIEGALASTAPVIAVMDGDLQHDEKILPGLVEAVSQEGFELAVATRYADGGSTGAWSRGRAAISTFATKLAELALKVRLSDPMSGFFVVDRKLFLEAAPRLSGVGYKILLDLICSSPRQLKITERPYTFRSRLSGESKLDAMIALQYVELLADKLLGRWVPVKFIAFAGVGALGLAVHLATLWTAINLFGAPFRPAQGVAVLTAMTFNFFLNNELTYRDRKLRGPRLLTGLASFCLVCGVGAVANVGVGAFVHERHSWWLAGVAGAAVGSVWNFAMGGLVTWKRR